MRYLINCAKIHPRLRLMMMAVMGTVHVVMTVHRQHLATAATAFIIGRMHIPPPTGRMARNTRWRRCPMTTTTNAQHHHPPHRRRRRRRDLHAISLTTSSSSSSSDATATQEPIIITPYTINQTICPSTHTTILEPLVNKHIHNLPQYWKNKPTAKHNEEAFELALEFVLRFGQQHLQPQLCLSKNQGRDCSSSSSSVRRTKVILDSGCGTGKSTHILGERYPDCVVIGIE